MLNACQDQFSEVSVSHQITSSDFWDIILVKWPKWLTVLFYVFIYIVKFLHVSSTSCSSSGETNCVNTTSGSCHPVSVAVSCAGRKWTSDLHTTQSDSYQRLYWHNLSLLLMSTMCPKHVES